MTKPTFQTKIFKTINLLIDDDSILHEAAVGRAKFLVNNYDGTNWNRDVIEPLGEYFSENYCNIFAAVCPQELNSKFQRHAGEIQLLLLQNVLDNFDWDDMAEHYATKAQEALRFEADEKHRARLTQF